MGEVAPAREIVDGVVADFCAEVVEEPLSFFSECDLQQMLALKLRDAFPEKIVTAVPKGPRSKAKYKTGLVHREYGAEKGQRIDVVVFSEEDAKHIDDWKLRKGRRYLEPQFGFELGTETVTNVSLHLTADINKLERRVDEEGRGYVIHVFRDSTVADAGTLRRKGTDERINRCFKQPVQQCICNPKIKVVAMVLRIGRKQKKIWGKCELFDRMHVRRWKKTNQLKVRAAVLELLSRTD